jgi:hypothetical protein
MFSTISSRTLRRTSAAIAAVAAGAIVDVPVISPSPAAASSVLYGAHLYDWGQDRWGRGCTATTADGHVVTVPSGTIMEQQIVVVTSDGTRKTFTVYYKCVDGEWERY